VNSFAEDLVVFFLRETPLPLPLIGRLCARAPSTHGVRSRLDLERLGELATVTPLGW